MSAELKLDMTAFNEQVRQVRDMIHRNGRSYVRTTARRLVRRLAWNCPKAPPRYGAAGRLRAGFWPAAMALGISNIYTTAPNKNEGEGVDQTGSASNPMFTIRNSVPYIGNLKQGLGWADTAMNGVRAQMATDLEKYARDSWARRAIIDDLTAG